jgi:hypothetical protein
VETWKVAIALSMRLALATRQAARAIRAALPSGRPKASVTACGDSATLILFR